MEMVHSGTFSLCFFEVSWRMHLKSDEMSLVPFELYNFSFRLHVLAGLCDYAVVIMNRLRFDAIRFSLDCHSTAVGS